VFVDVTVCAVDVVVLTEVGAFVFIVDFESVRVSSAFVSVVTLVGDALGVLDNHTVCALDVLRAVYKDRRDRYLLIVFK